ncbi:uncharacterized protein At2g29880-like [Neltuma alba]|uniref:uncharacterized protein At2g29880-like n=1 Tax=Neltuma alba TaxID=207710 RepID=UPI0010A599B5|nr:uncharacterized protein At2g29880-like [Prosopis alba]
MSDKSGKLDKHMWTPEEDQLLIHSMLAMHEKGELMSDNGLRPGVINKLKDMLHNLIPGCRIQAQPHIQSRIKKLKTHYGVVTDLLNLSGFGWDSDKKCVTAPKTVWDEYIKVNKNAAKFRHTPFLYFEELNIIYGKDRATGDESQQFDDVVEELNNQSGLDYHNDLNMNISHENNSPRENIPPEHNSDPTEHTQSDASVGSKKRKQNSADRDDFLLQGIEKIAHTFSDGLREASERLAMHMNRTGLSEREKRLNDMKDSLYDDLMQIEELSHQERLSAYVKMISDESMLVGFYATPQRGKADVIRLMIS